MSFAGLEKKAAEQQSRAHQKSMDTVRRRRWIRTREKLAARTPPKSISSNSGGASSQTHTNDKRRFGKFNLFRRRKKAAVIASRMPSMPSPSDNSKVSLCGILLYMP